MAAFTVDTHLFRELGQLLVGRDSTALVELVKNAYDADATKVVVFGEALDDPDKGIIKVEDNGVGMTKLVFENGFLRVASRIKDVGERRSAVFHRRFTGAKGIGRLAAHKLARIVQVESVAPGTEKLVTGTINWDKVEAFETLDAVDESAVNVAESKAAGHSQGTTITLRRLRQKWTRAQLGRFLAEVEAFKAPKLLAENLPEGLVVHETLFDQPIVAETTANDPGWEVSLEGEFAAGDSYWPAVAQTASWLLEIKADKKRVRYAVIPFKRTRDQNRSLEASYFHEPHPDPDNGPFFHARILIREGPGGSTEERAWAKHVSGIRVYMEGFRVLPYGDPTDDWLSLQRDTTDRTRKLRFLEDSAAAKDLPAMSKDEGLVLLPNKHYFGAVFLTASRAPSLSMLVNREGFIPDAGYELLVRLVRTGVDLSTRVRTAANARATESAVPDSGKAPNSRDRTELLLKDLENQAAQLRNVASHVDAKSAERIRAAASRLERTAEQSKAVLSAHGMVLVLASVGTQLAAFTHEVQRVLAAAQAVESLAGSLRDIPELSASLHRKLVQLNGAVGDLRRSLERQASYLLDVVSPDARRRRSRQPLRDRFDATARLVQRVAEGRSIRILNELDAALRTPPMFAAELTAVFTNLLTNAIKAAGEGGRIRATGGSGPDGVWVRIENTGAAVDPKNGERWFRPFESTTTNVDPVLGQGMGLGLGITRDILSEMGATIAFAPPARGYATALLIGFPK